ncbi:PEP-CTERM sorting domain-containing protein [Candidatus Nitrosacidococcus sp. I8]|uniref:PEP-CTERM sorting domain-containing protein n=1 Tax=Candidatus Nitrosacidococcus sp. I8 TaxID=2942908 RepID=UPI002226D33D|nr:PEP-CTERM sorting domain-containing protein [Candidatus Nitrosacidococcus sp. I8]CAH9018877.1 hypothetical protein NURINAE_01193 [Candidatus Nitrosacidococcus sp. I8]
MLSFLKKYLFPLLFGCSSITAQATIMFNPIYDDVNNNTGIGFDDPTIVGPNGLTLGQQRQDTLQGVFKYINTVINENGTFNLEVGSLSTSSPSTPSNSDNIIAGQPPLVYSSLSMDNTPTNDILAQGGANYLIQNGFNNSFPSIHITTGDNPCGEGNSLCPGVPSDVTIPDATIQFNFDQNWNSSLDAPAFDQYDLFTVALHEIAHDLGFDSFISETGASIYADQYGINAYTTYDSHLVLGDGTPLIPLINSAGIFDVSPSALTSNNVFFSGEHANAANGGNPIQVYAPSTWEQGSSLVHLNNPSDLMYYLIYPGTEKRTFSDVDLGILQDLGYNLHSANNGGNGGDNGSGGQTPPSNVPEPSSLALFLLGSIFIYSRRNLYSVI